MISSVVIFAATCLTLVASILFFPSLKIGKLRLNTYWLVALAGGILTVVFGGTDPVLIGKALLSDSAINPIKILVLFLSMTVLSIYLDELGFFRYLAGRIAQNGQGGQKKIFLCFYLLISVLTVFTSNDIIILSFTPFLCYFTRNAKINPIPYLIAEFFAANTWSMLFVIGNPTNIYLSTAYGIDFLTYLKISALPTFAAGILSFLLLFCLFRKDLTAPMQCQTENFRLDNKPALWLGVIHLAVCTALLVVCPYIGLEMWLIALCAAGSLFLCSLLLCGIQRKRPNLLVRTIARLPYPIIPFILSMFVMIVVLDNVGFTAGVASLIGGDSPVLTYGTLSFFSSNLINNIPMSVFFAPVISHLSGEAGTAAVYATVIGSNLGALFTPIGSLAGIMWSSVLAVHDVQFGYLRFLKIGVLVALPALAAALGALWFVLAI